MSKANARSNEGNSGGVRGAERLLTHERWEKNVLDMANFAKERAADDGISNCHEEISKMKRGARVTDKGKR